MMAAVVGIGVPLAPRSAKVPSSRMAATFVVPENVTQPCIVVPARIDGPGLAHAMDDPGLGQGSSQENPPGSITIRAIGRLSGPTIARTAAMAGGHESRATPGGSKPAYGSHRTVSAGGVPLGNRSGLEVAEGLGAGLAQATAATTATSTAATRLIARGTSRSSRVFRSDRLAFTNVNRGGADVAVKG